MKITLNWQKYLLVSLGLLILEIFLPSFWPIRLLVAGLFMILLAIVYGRRLLPETTLGWQIGLGFVFVNALLAIVGAGLIFFWRLNPLTIITTLTILLFIPLIWLVKNPLTIDRPPQLNKLDKISWLTGGGFLLALAATWFIYFQARSEDVIFSPWLNLPWYIFGLIGLAAICLVIYTLRVKGNSWLWLMSLFFLSLTALGAILYKLGYGFDGFIHEATLKIIQTTGTISPRPLYYLGEYSLIIFWQYLTACPLAFLNQWLVPLVFSALLPTSIHYGLAMNFSLNEKMARVLPLLNLIIPFATFTFSTPQALANIFLLLTILFCLVYRNNRPSMPWFFLALLAVATLTIHPLAGVPAILLVGLMFFKNQIIIKHQLQPNRRILFWIVFSIGLFVLPALFFLNAHLNNLSLQLSFNLPSFSFLTAWPHYYSSLADLIYFLQPLLTIIFYLLAIAGLIHILRYRRFNLYADIILVYLITFLNYIFFRFFVAFQFLIDYEQTNYTDRLPELLLLIALPLTLTGGYLLLEKLKILPRFYQVASLAILIMILLTSFYLSYPRRDTYEFSKAVNTTQTDIQVVQAIAADAPQDYVVLSNQAVAAAALKEFGFKKYFADKIFYYPLPTSSPLYQNYLDLAYSRQPIETVLAAVNKLTGVNDIYFVINKYWTEANKIISLNKKYSGDWQSIDDQAYIFHYYYQ